MGFPVQALPAEDPMIHYIDCGAAFISTSNHSVNSTLLPEELHPNTKGYRVLAACLKPVVDNLVLGEAVDLHWMSVTVHLITPSFAMHAPLQMSLFHSHLWCVTCGRC